MRIIIEHSETKREIKGPFNICADYDHLRLMISQIEEQIGDQPGYGWITIVEDFQESLANTEPLPWDS